MESYSGLDRSPLVGREDSGRPFDGYRRRSPGQFVHSSGDVKALDRTINVLPHQGLSGCALFPCKLTRC